jgi:hypothetical protein
MQPVAVRIQIRGDNVELSSFKQSARGTRYIGKAVKFKRDKKDKAKFDADVLTALGELFEE